MKESESIVKILGDIRNFMLSRKNILTVQEFAAYSGLSTSTIYKLTWERQIPHYKPGGKLIYFKRTEVDEWLLNNPVATIRNVMGLLTKLPFNKK